MDEPERIWNTWFHTYACRKPRALQPITFKPHHAPIFDPEDLPIRNVITKARSLIEERKAEGKQYRVFPYGSVDESYGLLCGSEACKRVRARKGRDLEGWFELMDVMEINRERLRAAEVTFRNRR